MSWARWLVALVALVAFGCDCTPLVEACTAGELDCGCDEAERCSDGLVCRDGRCENPVVGDAGGGGAMDAGAPLDARTIPDVGPNLDAFFAEDPPPMQCLEDGGMGPPPDPPGGTPDCPDDKNREGCRCEVPGEEAACWPGLRVNRSRGICRDGTTTCEPYDEFSGRWGPCRGAVLPTEGAATGASACRCFSQGRWAIENLVPCFITYGADTVYAVSTHPDTFACPTPSGPPPTPPADTWSSDTLTVDCEGRFDLCYTIRVGDAASPDPSDCIVSRVCTGSFWYMTRDIEQDLPPLPSWTGSDPACAAQFMEGGGYGEMSVIGLSVECDEIDDGSGGEYVFNRVNYCPLSCRDNPDAEGCESCMMGGSGIF